MQDHPASIGILLAPKMGALGAAIGIGTALILAHVLGMNIFYIKALRLDIPRFFKETHFQMVFPMITAGFAGYAVQHYFPILTWIDMFLIGSGFVVLFSLLMWVFAMNGEEKNLVLSLLPRVRK